MVWSKKTRKKWIVRWPGLYTRLLFEPHKRLAATNHRLIEVRIYLVCADFVCADFCPDFWCALRNTQIVALMCSTFWHFKAKCSRAMQKSAEQSAACQ